MENKEYVNFIKKLVEENKLEGQLEAYAKCMIRYANIKYRKESEE